MIRIAVLLRDRCQPKRCGLECIHYCPPVRTGVEAIAMGQRGKPIISEELCVGCGTCQGLCPDIFELNEDLGKSTVIRPQGGDEACIEEAIAACPAEAISRES